MNALEKKIKSEILKVTENDFSAFAPSMQLQAVSGGRLRADVHLGKTYQYYDLASLTKIIFAASAFMRLHDERRIHVNDRVSAILDWWPHKRMHLREVLSHSAGLPWWAPFYKNLDLKSPSEMRRKQVKKILLRSQLSKDKKAVYSDLDLILLGFVLEEICDQPLLEIWENLPWREAVPFLHFNPGNRPQFKRSLYAPTERCPWRRKVLQGEVHDENTWSFGGVSTHAGLFGRIEDVTAFGLLLRKAYLNGNTLATRATARLFTRRAIPPTRGDWALGFMLPTKYPPPGTASCGRYFHGSSFGHTGFTGTSLWYDPKRDLLVTILSNRVHPTRDNGRFVKLRPLLHDIVVETLGLI